MRFTHGPERALILRYSWSLKILSDPDRKNEQMPPKGDWLFWHRSIISVNTYGKMSMETNVQNGDCIGKSKIGI